VARTVRYAADALQLRRLATRILRASGPDPADWARAATLSASAWTVFLGAEQCAAALSEAAPGRAPGTPGGLLARHATDDAQRSLSAQAQLRLIGQIAATNGWQVVALKGGLAAGQGRSLHLLDIDVLARGAHAAALAAALAERIGDSTEGVATARHLAPMGSRLGLPLEVHTSIDNRWMALTTDAWTRVRPLAGVPGVWRLHPRDHLTHLLIHSVIDHPERRGRLRDTLLIRQALAECDPDDLAIVAAGLARTPYASPLAQQLEFARDLAAQAPDPFEPAAFVRFWFMLRERPERRAVPVWSTIQPTIRVWTMGLTSGWVNRQWWLDGVLAGSDVPSKLRLTAWLERTVPLAGRAVRLVQRALHYAGAYAVAWPLSRAIRRAARQAGVVRASRPR
jgi:hypothetical protein